MRAILDVIGLREVVEHSSRHIRGTASQVRCQTGEPEGPKLYLDVE